MIPQIIEVIKMKHGSLRASLLMICIFAAQAVAAQCPEGKSEVVVVTPSGVSKNICVAQAAIPGIENAANNEVIEIVPVCPCVDVWTGVYSDDVTVDGTPPALPVDLTGSQCDAVDTPNLSAVVVALAEGFSGLRFGTDTNPTGGTGDLCYAQRFNPDSTRDTAYTTAPFATLYPQEIIGNGTIDDPRLHACRQFLASRGCTFN